MNLSRLTHRYSCLRFFLIFFITVFVSLIYLRLRNLGYSDFIPDETTVMTPVRDGVSVLSPRFMLAQNKGPGQFAVAKVVALLGASSFNEYAFRFPFVLANIAALTFLFFYLKNLTHNKWAALAATAVFGVNGFIVAFGRIVQYQSLNLFFTILSLYLFEIYSRRRDLKWAVFGSLAFALSFLSHWDALLAAPLIAYYLIKGSTLKRFLSLIGIGVFLTFPFGIPFLANLSNRPEFIAYITSRVGFTDFNPADTLHYYRFFAELYNPFYFVPFFLVSLGLILLTTWKKWPYYIWLVLHLILFTFFVRQSGAHLYNVLLPFTIMFGYFLASLPRYLQQAALIFVFGCAVFWLPVIYAFGVC